MMTDEIYKEYYDSAILSLPLPDDWQDGAAYIRVSTDRQEELSPDAQLRLILEYARNHQIRILPDYIYLENGISGRQARKRPKFQEMIATAKKDPVPFRQILLWKFSRFARNQEEAILYKSLLRKQRGIEVVSISEPILEGPFGALNERIIEWMDEYYSTNLSGEVRRGMTEKARRGGYQSTPPLGYRSPGPGQPFVVDPDTAPIVSRIFTQYNSGKEPTAIARELNDMGCRTRRGNAFEKRNVTYILKNRFYDGYLIWNGIETSGAHERIISAEEFAAAQKRLKSTFKPHGRRGVNYCRHWLSGLLKCPICGSTLAYNPGSGDGFWQCWKYAKGYHRGSCSISVRKAEHEVLSYFESLMEGTPFAYAYRPVMAPQTANLSRHQSDLKKLDQKEARVRAAYENGIDTLEEYRENRERIRQERERLQKLLAAAQSPQPAPPRELVLQRIRTVLELLQDDQADSEAKGSMLRSIVEDIVVDKPHDRLVFHLYIQG